MARVSTRAPDRPQIGLPTFQCEIVLGDFYGIQSFSDSNFPG